jgi:hypothetical protein
MMLIIN